jgi:hypothetical protein
MASTTADGWPNRRRYLPLRWLRAPIRHVASVRCEDDARYVAACICGWQGGSHTHRGSAFADAHVHTRHIDTKILDPSAPTEP